jgi:hypothetical protein
MVLLHLVRRSRPKIKHLLLRRSGCGSLGPRLPKLVLLRPGRRRRQKGKHLALGQRGRVTSELVRPLWLLLGTRCPILRSWVLNEHAKLCVLIIRRSAWLLRLGRLVHHTQRVKTLSDPPVGVLVRVCRHRGIFDRKLCVLDSKRCGDGWMSSEIERGRVEKEPYNSQRWLRLSLSAHTQNL